MTYLFKTTTTMKEYNRDKWWIDSKIVSDITIEADTLTNALYEYRTRVNDNYWIEISNNALKTRSPMYRDTDNGTKQIGFVLTGKTEFARDYKWIAQYIDLWVEIVQIGSIFD